jgi:hypothetical protein
MDPQKSAISVFLMYTSIDKLKIHKKRQRVGISYYKALINYEKL